MFVHPFSTRQQVSESVGTNGDHQCQTDCRPERETTPHPIPERKYRILPDSELHCTLGLGSQRSEVSGHGSGVAKIGHQPVTRRLRIEHRFLGSEGPG